MRIYLIFNTFNKLIPTPMPDQTIEQPVFYVGLCMAGAVSAGAYTAGVMDYLLEALAEWEKRRGQPGVPQHRVQIPVMGGASAGGMTSIMAASALNNKLTPIDKPGADLLAEHPENKLYHSWVDLTDVDMFSKMLNTDDIKNGKILAILNSSFIDPIAERVVSVDSTPPNWLPLPPFIKPGLKVFTTLSNLQGFDYTIDFNTNTPQTGKYNMVIHNDYACFELTETAIDGDNKGWIPLNLKDGTNKEIAANSAMATGAFPVGLQSRTVSRPSQYINNNPWLKDYLATNPINQTANPNLSTLNVDGGLINNEPFEKVRDVLVDLTGQQQEDYQDFNKSTSTVLMIEPFPTSKSSTISTDQGLLNVAALTFSSMRTQTRSKPVHFAEAYQENCAGQYLITPSRLLKGSNGDTDLTGELAIACGALEGFSGFINKEFRVHDYFLGRYNCKIFLRDYFTVPESTLENNPVFKQGYVGTNRELYKSQKDGGYQIIPVFADATDYTFPDFTFKSGTNWPTIQNADIDKFQGAMKSRVKAVLPNLISLNGVLKSILAAAGFLGLYNKVTDAIIGKIKSELHDWNLLP